MKKDDLTRLHWIRKQREEKALNAVIASQGALRHAERAAAEASLAAADDASRAVDRERGALGAVVGKALRRHELLNLQSNLDAAADAQRKLKATEKAAAQSRDLRRGELEKARTIFRHHNREAEKLGQIVKQRNTQMARKRMVFAEASDDELHGRAVPDMMPALTASRSEDA
jgi:DNA primase